MYWFWRFVYWVLERPVALSLAGSAVRALRMVKGHQVDEIVLAAIDRRFVHSGWPIQARGAVNLHASRFRWRLYRQLRPAAPAPSKPHQFRASRVRVGCVGEFSGALGFPRELFEAFPSSEELVIFDIPYKGRSAEYLREIAASYYNQGSLDSAAWAGVINAADLDVLLNISWKRPAYDLLDHVTAPCIMHFCGGADVFHHDKVNMQLHSVAGPDYFHKDGSLFCGLTRTPMKPYVIRQKTALYDLRHLRIEPPVPWRDRAPLLTFHGSLYKLASPSYLDCLFKILADDKQLQLVFMGKDDGAALAVIERTARAWSVHGQVHYDGQFDAVRDVRGDQPDDGWHRMVAHLRRARLACEPWPIGGGSSRLEAYALGVPSTSLRLRFDPAAWGTRQLVIAEVTALHAPSGAVATVDAYETTARRCLYDDAFATALVEEQLAIARMLTDTTAWWREVFEYFHEWRLARGPRGAAQPARTLP
jgi:hypothetical protein